MINITFSFPQQRLINTGGYSNIVYISTCFHNNVCHNYWMTFIYKALSILLENVHHSTPPLVMIYMWQCHFPFWRSLYLVLFQEINLEILIFSSRYRSTYVILVSEKFCIPKKNTLGKAKIATIILRYKTEILKWI